MTKAEHNTIFDALQTLQNARTKVAPGTPVQIAIDAASSKLRSLLLTSPGLPEVTP